MFFRQLMNTTVFALSIAGSVTISLADRPDASFRRPVAAVWVESDAVLAVANQRSASISLVDVKANKTLGETRIGKRISHLTKLPNSHWLLATDEQSGELVELSYSKHMVSVIARIPVSPFPVKVIVDAGGKRAFVSSSWTRRLSVFDILHTGKSQAPVLKLVQELALPFSPRELLLLADNSKLAVADSFGGQLAIVDVATMKIDSIRNVPTHNIRGLAVNGDGSRLLISQQILNSLAHSSKEDVHWGLLMTNCVRSLPMDNVLNPKAKLLKNSQLALLGNAGNGAGDPAGFSLDNQERLVVTLAGTNEVAVGRVGELYADRVDVGRRPTAILLNEDRDHAYVLNTFSDSVTVVDLNEQSAKSEISLGPMPKPSAVDRGEILFYSARLAHDNWMTCHSCHSDGHSNGLLADTQGDGSFGAPKRVLSLLGAAETKPWAWNGGMMQLSKQIHKSVQTTMRGQPAEEEDVADLIAYLQTLAPPPTSPTLGESASNVLIARGKQVFAAQGCAKCHVPPLYTSKEVYDVGLTDELGNRKFNPPSLRGARHRSAYFHDLRAKSLRAVFTEHGHQIQSPLADDQQAALIAFLRSL